MKNHKWFFWRVYAGQTQGIPLGLADKKAQMQSKGTL